MKQQLVSLVVAAGLAASCFALDFSIGPPDYASMVEYRGNASVSSTSLQLTTNSLDESYNHSVGRAYYKSSVLMQAATSFSTWFTFQITYLTCSGGDGLTFFILPRNEDLPSGSQGKYLGLLNSTSDGNRNNHLFAVEFDTFANQEDNPQTGPHVGVDINSINSTFASAVSSLNGSFQAWVDYDGSTKKLEVRISNKSDPWPINAQISEVIGLEDVLQGNRYVGFSASTGDCAGIHKVLQWNFSAWEGHRSCKGYSCKKTQIFAYLMGSVSLVGVIVLLYWWFYREQRLHPRRHSSRHLLSHFSFSELKEATNGFSEDRLLGSGGYGKVYKAHFRDSTFAVKVLKEGSLESEHQFLAELSALSEFQHPNLLGLKGWCHARGKMMLVYEYMQNGSLEQHLFSKEQMASTKVSKLLEWGQRLEIIKGVAEALQFLHEGRTIHRDIKSANVLLDKDYNAKLGDFGLSRLINEGGGLQTMTKVGTFGYIAPEIAYAGRATDKSDVYSFGILAMELVTGMQILSGHLYKEQGLTLLEWIWLMHERQSLLEVVDARMISEKAASAEMWKSMLHLAMWCCSPDPMSRPSMKEICEMLRGNITPPNPPPSRPTYLFSMSNAPSFRVPSSLLTSIASTSSENSTQAHAAPGEEQKQNP